MIKLIKHLKTIMIHRKYVKRMCFKMGIPLQGLFHDLSKYSFKELSICEYYVGDKSPHQVSRELIGYSASWIHHYHKNKHHWEYWLDDDENGKLVPIKIPYRYTIEMFCDMVGAGKSYMKKDWTVEDPWNYYINKCKGKRLMNRYSEYLLEKLLWNLKELKTEKTFIHWYKQIKHYLVEMYEREKLDY